MVLTPDMFEGPKVDRGKLKSVLLGLVGKIFETRAHDHNFLPNYPRLSDNITYQYSTPEALFTDSLNRALHYAQAGITELDRANILIQNGFGGRSSLNDAADKLGASARAHYAECFKYLNFAFGKKPEEKIEIPDRQMHLHGD